MTEQRLKALVTNPTLKNDGNWLPYLALEHVEPGRGRLIPGIELEESNRDDAVLVQSADVLFGKLRPYLAKTVFAECDMISSPELLVLRSRPSAIDPRFLYWLTQSKSFIGWSVAGSEGVKMPRTDWIKLGDYRSDVGDLPQQRKIADFLDRECAVIDEMLSEQSKLVGFLAEHAEAFVAGQIEEARASSDADELPLKRCAFVTVGIVIQPSKWYVSEGGVPALRGLNVQRGRVSQDDLVFISDEGNTENSKSTLRRGDLVVVRTGNAGSAALVPDWAVDGNAIDLLLVRPGAKVDARYLEILLNSQFVREQILMGSVGALQSHFNVGALRNLTAILPPLPTQKQIARRVNDYESEVAALTEELEQQTNLLLERRQALVTAAVTGQAEVPE